MKRETVRLSTYRERGFSVREVVTDVEAVEGLRLIESAKSADIGTEDSEATVMDELRPDLGWQSHRVEVLVELNVKRLEGQCGKITRDSSDGITSEIQLKGSSYQRKRTERAM